MKAKQTEFKNQEHGGACPTCGHCKCCEKKAAQVVTVPVAVPCTRRHSDVWPWNPSPVWYGTNMTNTIITGTTQTFEQEI